MIFRQDWKYVLQYFVVKGCTNSGPLSPRQLTLYGAASYTYICVYGPSVWSLLLVAPMAPRIGEMSLRFLKFCGLLVEVS